MYMRQRVDMSLVNSTAHYIKSLICFFYILNSVMCCDAMWMTYKCRDVDVIWRDIVYECDMCVM